MITQTYLFFEGRCEEALAFYRQAMDAEVTMLMRYSESPDPPPPDMLPPGSGNKIMHSSLRIGDTDVMASDGMCSGKTVFAGFSISLTADSEADAQRYFSALAKDGTVQMPLQKTFFSPCFGMLQDRFGVGWMVIVPAPETA